MIIISIYTNHNKFVEISGLNSSRNEKKRQNNSCKNWSLNKEEEIDFFRKVSNIIYDTIQNQEIQLEKKEADKKNNVKIEVEKMETIVLYKKRKTWK